MDLVIVEQGSEEWQYIWDYVANHPINEGIDEPRVAFNQGEQFQYMGSYRQGDKVCHSIRHRFHPRNNDRVNLTFHASDKFTSEQISKVIKVK
jgi:hypothetical protein